MSEYAQFDQKNLCTIKEAATAVSYSRDYITRLARDGKIAASLVGRQWYVDLASLQSYAATMEAEQEIRKRQLSEERRRERQLLDAVSVTEEKFENQKSDLQRQAYIAVAAVFLFGLISGAYVLQFGPLAHVSHKNQVSQVSASQNITLIDERAPQHTPEFVHTFTEFPFGTAEQGIFLLPQGSTSTEDISKYFSDEVVVRTNEFGQLVLVKVDADQVPYGNEIPFLSVPITTEGE